MRFHRLLVRNFRGIRCAAAVEFPQRGVAVLEGANEAGKSSLMEAVDVLFALKDSSQHRRITEAHRVDADEAPSVELEASSGPYRFVYAKKWARRGVAGGRGSGGSTTLRIISPRVENLTGPRAEARAGEILAETLDRQLWDALRLMQSDATGPLDLSGSAALRAALDATAGSAADAGESGDALLAAVRAEYGTYFTATGKPTGELARVRRALGEAERASEAADAAVRQVDELVGEHARLVESCADLTGRLEQRQRQRDELAAQARAQQEQRQVVSQARVALERAVRDERDSAARLSEREGLVAAVSAREAAVAAATGALEDRRLAERSAAASLETARSGAQAARTALEDARSMLAAIRRGAEEASLRAEQRTLRARLARAGELDAQLAGERAALAGLPVDPAALNRVREAQAALDRAEVAQQAASARVRVLALSGQMRVFRDGEPVDAGEEGLSWAITEATELSVPGVLRIELEPAAGAAGRAEEVTAARARLAGLLRELSAGSVAEAVAAGDARAATQARVRELEAERQAAIGGDDLSGLRDRLAQVTSLLSARAAGPETGAAGQAAELPADPAELAQRITELERAEDDARHAGTQAEARVEHCREIADRAGKQASAAESELRAATRELEQCQARLVAARAQCGDAELAEAHAVTQAALALASRERDQAEELVTDSDAGELLEAAEHAAQAALTRLRREQEALLRVEAVLGEFGGQGRAEQAAAAADALAAARRSARLVERQAAAVRLLAETLDRHRDAARAAYVKPFQQAVERLGRRVYGPGFSVVVGPDLGIVERVLDGVNVPYAALSAGAQEQLAVLVRLAVAGLVDPVEGVPVVIDDALGHSDPHRVLATSAVLAQAGERAQVILLTCTPGRHDAIPGATVIRVASGPEQ